MLRKRCTDIELVSFPLLIYCVCVCVCFLFGIKFCFKYYLSDKITDYVRLGSLTQLTQYAIKHSQILIKIFFYLYIYTRFRS